MAIIHGHEFVKRGGKRGMEEWEEGEKKGREGGVGWRRKGRESREKGQRMKEGEKSEEKNYVGDTYSTSAVDTRHFHILFFI